MSGADYVDELDALRTALRRRAITEGWPALRLALVEDLADTANSDGTHALRSIEAQASRLRIGTATVKRHRAELREVGVLVERRRGGQGRGAAVLDLSTGDGQGSLLTAMVIPDVPDEGSVGDQSGITVERDGDPPLLSSSPTSKQQGGNMEQAASDLAKRLSLPVDQCLAVIQAKADREGPVRYPRGWTRSILNATWRAELAARQPAQPRAVVTGCAGRCPGERHEWTEGPNRWVCMGD